MVLAHESHWALSDNLPLYTNRFLKKKFYLLPDLSLHKIRPIQILKDEYKVHASIAQGSTVTMFYICQYFNVHMLA
jgi:hypothetical protein